MDEFGLIETFLSAFQVPPSPLGPGDDCAVLPAPRHAVCVTTDALVEGVHFTRKTFSLSDVGAKALAVNLSDLAAMGARPTWALCALGLPKGTTARQVRALAEGMAPAAKAHGVSLVGGNVTRAEALSITLTVAGEAKRPVLRSTGRPGDGLYVTGPLGLAAAGLEALSAGARGPRVARLLAAQRRPTPHLAVGRAAAPFVSAGLDVSDGLLQDLGHLCAASGVGADVERHLLPLDVALLRWCDGLARAQALALSGGEDYVLLLAVPPQRSAAFERALGRAGFDAVRIGALSRTRGIRVDGRPIKGRAGFQHF